MVRHYGSPPSFVQIGALYRRRGFRARRKCGKFSALLTVHDFFTEAYQTPSESKFESPPEPTVDKAELQKLSELAKIEIDADMVEQLTNSVNDILALVDQLKAVDTVGVEALANPTDANQRLRVDEVNEPNQRDEFLAIAPQTENGLFLVPKVIE